MNVRVAWAAVDLLDARTREEGLTDAAGRPNRSEMVRRMLTFAARNMPRGWTP